MNKLEQILAQTIAMMTNIDIPAIIDAAREEAGETVLNAMTQTVQATPVAQVETPPTAAEAPKRTRKTAAAPVEQPPPPPPPPAETPPPPPPAPEKAPEAAKPIGGGIDLTGLFEGSGASKKVVKTVFLAAVEKANALAPLVALNEVCDCGFATGDYTEETAAVLKRKLTRWGNAQE